MKSPLLVRSLAIAAVFAPLACSLLRDFDGFSEGLLDAGDASFADVATDVDAPRDAATDGADSAAPRPTVQCTIETIWTDGGTTSRGDDFPWAIADDNGHVVLATGTYNNPLNDAGKVLRDSGALVRVDPDSRATKTLMAAMPPARSVVARDGVVYFVSQSLDGGGLWRTTALMRDGGVQEVESATGLPDLTESDAGLWLMHRAPTQVGLRPNGANEFRFRDVSSPARFAVDETRVAVARSAGAGDAGVSIYPAADWPGDGGDAAAKAQCDFSFDASVASPNIVALGPDGRVYLADGTGLYVMSSNTCARVDPGRAADPNFNDTLSIATNEKFLFVRYTYNAVLYWHDDLATSACNVTEPISQRSRTSGAAQVAFFRGDDVYFIAPPSVYRIKVTIQP